MEAFNQALFLLINAPAHPNAMWLTFAKILADDMIWLAPLTLAGIWLRGDEADRRHALEAAIAGLVALLIAQIIGLVWPHPRPFMIGVGHTLIPHVADSSFPSDHATLLWAIAFSLLLHRNLRLSGAALAMLGLPVAWARIYLGVHFPLDMMGAALVATGSAWLCWRTQRWIVAPIFPSVSAIYRGLFAPFIRCGWVRR